MSLWSFFELWLILGSCNHLVIVPFLETRLILWISCHLILIVCGAIAHLWGLWNILRPLDFECLMVLCYSSGIPPYYAVVFGSLDVPPYYVIDPISWVILRTYLRTTSLTSSGVPSYYAVVLGPLGVPPYYATVPMSCDSSALASFRTRLVMTFHFCVFQISSCWFLKFMFHRPFWWIFYRMGYSIWVHEWGLRFMYDLFASDYLYSSYVLLLVISYTLFIFHALSHICWYL